MELINSVTGVDEEGRSRQKILTYTARRYASAIEKNPGDYDALYNWALVLQESADNVDPDSPSPSKDALLEEACRKYEEATHLCPTLHDVVDSWESLDCWLDAIRLVYTIFARGKSDGLAGVITG